MKEGREDSRKWSTPALSFRRRLPPSERHYYYPIPLWRRYVDSLRLIAAFTLLQSAKFRDNSFYSVSAFARIQRLWDRTGDGVEIPVQRRQIQAASSLTKRDISAEKLAREAPREQARRQYAMQSITLILQLFDRIKYPSHFFFFFSNSTLIYAIREERPGRDVRDTSYIIFE